MSLVIEKEYEENSIRVIPIGDLDIITSPNFKEEVTILIDEKKEILVDFGKLEYMDSTGLGVLISLYKKTKDNNLTFCLTNLKPNIYKLFDITGLNNVFKII